MAEVTDFQHVWVQGSDPRALILFHGTGGDERSLLRFAEILAPGHSVLAMRGKVLENGANRFFRRFAEGVLDLDDVRLRATEIADWLLAAAKHYGIVLSDSVSFGYSNGANIVAALWAIRPESIGHGVFARTMLPLRPESQVNLSNKRGLVLVGSADTITPAEHAESLASAMASKGAGVTLHRFPSGHELSQADFEVARDWISSLFSAQAPDKAS